MRTLHNSSRFGREIPTVQGFMEFLLDVVLAFLHSFNRCFVAVFEGISQTGKGTVGSAHCAATLSGFATQSHNLGIQHANGVAALPRLLPECLF